VKEGGKARVKGERGVKEGREKSKGERGQELRQPKISKNEKIAHNVRNELAEFVVPLRKNRRQSVWAKHAKYKGPPWKRIGRKGRKGTITFS